MPAEDTIGELLWTPSPHAARSSELSRYLTWLEEQGLDSPPGPGATPADRYAAAWQWSVNSPGEFWQSVWRYFDVRSTSPYQAPLTEKRMPGARWFPGARLNWAEHVLRGPHPDTPALIALSEGRPTREISWTELRAQVGALAASLRELGVRRGDRVAAYLPNIPEAVVGVLACASIGAVWSSCGPDFGVAGVTDRFRQVEPVVLLAVDGYTYGGKVLDRRSVVAELRAGLPSLRHVVYVAYQYPEADLRGDPGAHLWSELVARQAEPEFVDVPFEHPLWILFSSGTTGLPKGLVQGHGGILLEQLKLLAFHLDVGPGDRFFWFTSTSWMMWNVVVGSLLRGATAVLYDGSPTYPDLGGLWRIADSCRLTHLGTSAGYLMACQKAALSPGESLDLSSLRVIGSTGSPLPPTGFRWVYSSVSGDVWLNSLSGGTDVCTAFVAGNPLLPVHAGEIQCRCLGSAVYAWNESGQPVINEVGELVLTVPMPSMPTGFWGDSDGLRYHDAYFDVYPGVWRHGDWCTITSRGGIVIHGRSDATLNKQGVRMGSADIYEVVEGLPEIVESLVVGIDQPNGGYWMPLFVHLAPGAELTDELRLRITSTLRAQLSPRHVPDEIIVVPGVPHTRTGKRLEVPVKRLLQGGKLEAAVNLATVDDPALLRFFADLATKVPDGR